MARQRRKGADKAAEISMTPMIDVVFQLLVYFVFTIKPMDVAAHLDVFQPAPGEPPPEAREPPKMLRIQIFQGALLMNDKTVTLDYLGATLKKLASISKTQTVMIMCALDSKHDMLIKVLDRCADAGLTNLSVVSMN